MAKKAPLKVVKTIDQSLNTVALLAKKVATEAGKNEDISLIMFYGKKAEPQGEIHINASYQTAFQAVMQLMYYIGCDMEEQKATAVLLQKGIERRFPKGELEEVPAKAE